MTPLRQNHDPHYSIVLGWDPDGNVYIATVPELPGCHTLGATLEEAVTHAQNVIGVCVDALREEGRHVPPPKYFDLDGPNPPGWGY